jgi:hypothetical protein
MDGEKTLHAIADLVSHKQNGDDLLSAVKVALDLFLELKDANEEQRADILARFQALESDTKKRVAQIKDGEPGPKGEPGTNAEPPTADELLALIRPLIPQPIKGDDGKPGTDGSPDMAEDIRNKLELLEDDERLDASAIKNLETYVKQYAPKQTSGGTTGLIGRGRVHYYDLSPFLDGVTKTFNIPAVWAVLSVSASSSPGALRPVIDYTNDTQSITFTDQILASGTLEAGQTVVLLVEDA